jgi:hypothetical protein
MEFVMAAPATRCAILKDVAVVLVLHTDKLETITGPVAV